MDDLDASRGVRMSTARERGLGHGLRIQRECEPTQWRERIEAIPDAEERAVAREYLRGIWHRARVALAVRARIDERKRAQADGDRAE